MIYFTLGYNTRNVNHFDSHISFYQFYAAFKKKPIGFSHRCVLYFIHDLGQDLSTHK